MYRLGHKVKICMKDTYNSQQTVSTVKTVLSLSLVPYRTETLTQALEWGSL
jgi:hypothetical protein